MATITESHLADSRQTIETRRPTKKTKVIDTLRQLASQSGQSIGTTIRDHIKTNFGKGKLSFDDYLALNLWDAQRYKGVNLQQFVGLRAMRPIWYRANYRIEFYDTIRNKVTMSALLDAYGLPTIPILGLFSKEVGFGRSKCLRSTDALREFLTNSARYPLFGKPMSGMQSLGTTSMLRYDEGENGLVSTNGTVTPLDTFIDEVTDHYDDGYIFQPRISPHRLTKAVCGDRLATVRVLTVLTKGSPKIWRVCEKIPAGPNVADNYWRSGNILVQLDPATGTRLSAVTGAGLGLRDLNHHPDSGAAIIGTKVPNWDTVCNLALEGARLLKDVALIGWDIAPVNEGAIVVEANVTPDPFLPQLADRRGLLDDEFHCFLAERDRMARAWKRMIRKHDLDSYRPSFWN